jgi:hypothetical protein
LRGCRPRPKLRAWHLGAGKFPPQHLPHRHEVRTGRDHVVHHGDDLRRWFQELPIDLVARPRAGLASSAKAGARIRHLSHMDALGLA